MQNYKTCRWWQRESERPWAWQWDQRIQFGSGLDLDRISKAWPMKERIDKLDAIVWMCPPQFISQNLTPRGMYVWDHTRAAAGDTTRCRGEVARHPGEPGASITGERVPGMVPLMDAYSLVLLPAYFTRKGYMAVGCLQVSGLWRRGSNIQPSP